MISRRTFIEKLGLGAGASLLGSITGTLLAQAHGAVVRRKRIVFVVGTNGIHAAWNFVPREFITEELQNEKYPNAKWDPLLPGRSDFTWPAMVKSLAPYRQRMLLIDGLRQRVLASQHSAGYALLSGYPVTSGRAEAGGPPGGITIDQYIANRIGVSTRFKSILCGIDKAYRTKATSIFAAGRERPEPYITDPALLHRTLFGETSNSGSANAQKATVRRRVLLDHLRADVKRLQQSLAGPERQKLDHYLSAIEEYDKRQQIPVGGERACDVPGAPAAVQTPDAQLSSMFDMVTLALACGLTNVVGIAIGTGHAHLRNPGSYEVLKRFRIESGIIKAGDPHGGRSDQAPGMDVVHDYHASLIARMVATLSAIKDNEKDSVFDNTVIVYTNDSGCQHHGGLELSRSPVVIIGDAGGALRSDGRYLRYPRAGDTRSMSDLYCSLGHVTGAATDTFGAGGVEPVKGPLGEIMA